MPPVIPTSLSPHICVLTSPDLEDVLATASVPSLPQILQSFSPLPQVTTRTTALASVSHASFALRFSDLQEIEAACREPEENRAMRMLDWISARISSRCAQWVEDMEKAETAEKERYEEDGRDIVRTPWWDELRRCAEGDCVPGKGEGWNHPVAVILAASTTAPNPLQAITTLHSRSVDLPTWVDPAQLRYTLIVHPQNSPLSDEEAGALLNAVKKQYGLHVFLLPLSLPSPPPPPVQVPALLPKLPLSPSIMSEQDIQATVKFVREFVTMSLIPWMEKCVIDWNENYSASRRLPSRLFSSTRRLFGSSYAPGNASPTSASPRTSHSSTSSVPSIASSATLVGGSEPLQQQRRLAEFATILGDLKLAVSIWESLRKEGRGGSDILPMLVAPGPNVQLYASYAISSLHPLMTSGASDLPPQILVKALKYAVRWDIAISQQDFLSDVLEGDRWLVWAAVNVEEVPPALLLGHAALLSARRRARRRAALWYYLAANRLEKCGIRPLTMYFLRRAGELCASRPPMTLSPSFWESEDISPTDWQGFEAIRPGLGHALGRLLYTTGRVEEAIRLFVTLLQRRPHASSSLSSASATILNGIIFTEPSEDSADKLFISDFKTAFQHFLSTSGDPEKLRDLKLPCTFSVPNQSRVRLPRQSASLEGEIWNVREQAWREFWKTRGSEPLEPTYGSAYVDETFWFDLVVENPLDVEISLCNVTITIHELGTMNLPPRSINFDSHQEIVLEPRERRIVPIPITVHEPCSLTIAEARYDFLSFLPCTERLALKGARLHATPAQRQSKMYGPDQFITVTAKEGRQRLLVDFVEDEPLVLAHGENRRMDMWLSSCGTKPIGELWLLVDANDILSVIPSADDVPEFAPKKQVRQSDNSLRHSDPLQISLESISDSNTLVSGRDARLSVVIHSDQLRDQDLTMLFVYREAPGSPFHSTRIAKHYEVSPTLDISVSSQPSRTPGHPFLLNVDITNVSAYDDIRIQGIMTMSPTWLCSGISRQPSDYLQPSQMLRWSFSVRESEEGQGISETYQYVSRTLHSVLRGESVDTMYPPPIDILCCHHGAESIQDRRRCHIRRQLLNQYRHIPPSSHPHIFPLYNPAAVDIAVFWYMPGDQRAGYTLFPGLNIGAGHGALQDMVNEVEEAKVRRSMYAETQMEKTEILQSVRSSEWNTEMYPVIVSIQDGRTMVHDFSGGPCQTTCSIAVRNYSRTHPARYTLKLNSRQTHPNDLLPPPYSGRRIHRGVLGPSEVVLLNTQLRISRPGRYALASWSIETELGEPSYSAEQTDSWQTRRKYVQDASSADTTSIIVHDFNHRA
ncbi:hypothetical protein PUNSTDRAFT_59603 [Punctularia strigosozonata HHB-11173 SS5]|uniref:uncharacterized protein n=1 Tax=Punctularia strigosozonata (strain HHB-11173) TaxID=741275 RepID=UPI000441787F|nr:uncharacterized protein PUNSTDRAFT_59603 [Punctularia strigosozonata HHB-11173 SS5]EIN14080.1 hypothetical protein PUNSTDRAFT_59603 [Punctularia strigosozonata HHB-11173 SS5]